MSIGIRARTVGGDDLYFLHEHLDRRFTGEA
jgi:hypothetical protein